MFFGPEFASYSNEKKKELFQNNEQSKRMDPRPGQRWSWGRLPGWGTVSPRSPVHFFMVYPVLCFYSDLL